MGNLGAEGTTEVEAWCGPKWTACPRWAGLRGRARVKEGGEAWPRWGSTGGAVSLTPLPGHSPASQPGVPGGSSSPYVGERWELGFHPLEPESRLMLFLTSSGLQPLPGVRGRARTWEEHPSASGSLSSFPCPSPSSTGSDSRAQPPPSLPQEGTFWLIHPPCRWAD